MSDHPKTVKLECAFCGLMFERRYAEFLRTERKNGKHYCSKSCMGQGYKNRVTLVCSECGCSFDRAKSGVNENNKHHFCSKECQSKNTNYILSGENHYRYIDGNTSYKRGSNWRKQSASARKRDKNTCQYCGKTELEIGKKLDVHHVKPYRLFDDYVEANNLDNLITLCPSCHHRADALLNRKA